MKTVNCLTKLLWQQKTQHVDDFDYICPNIESVEASDAQKESVQSKEYFTVPRGMTRFMI